MWGGRRSGFVIHTIIQVESDYGFYSKEWRKTQVLKNGGGIGSFGRKWRWTSNWGNVKGVKNDDHRM